MSSGMMIRSKPWDLHPIPDQITLEDGERVRKLMRKMVKGNNIDTYYPRSLITYATGRRPGIDAAGTGPGMYYALWIAMLLEDCGEQCFSGLCVPGGADWTVFVDKLGGRFSKCEFLFVVQTDALYHSRPCLRELYTAVDKKRRILPVLFEESRLLFKPGDQWPEIEPEDSEGKKWLLEVQRVFGALNSVPSPPSVAQQDPTALMEYIGNITPDGLSSDAASVEVNPRAMELITEKYSGKLGIAPKFDVLQCGTLHESFKDQVRGAKWRERYCVLTSGMGCNALHLFDIVRRGSLPATMKFARESEISLDQTILQITAGAAAHMEHVRLDARKQSSTPYAFTLETDRRSWSFRTKTDEEKARWASALQPLAKDSAKRVVERGTGSVKWFTIHSDEDDVPSGDEDEEGEGGGGNSRPRICVSFAAQMLFTELNRKHDGVATNVIAIFGAARQGKSTFMNLLSGSSAFETSDRMSKPCTDGVDSSVCAMPHWRFCVGGNDAPKPAHPNQHPHLSFVDAEGQGDKDVAYDVMLVTPVLLMAKVVIWNWKGGFQKDAMLNLLGAMAESARSVKLTDVGNGIERPPFHHLHIVIRDTDEDSEDYRRALLDEEAKRGRRRSMPEDQKNRNTIRTRLKKAFASIDVWSFPPPSNTPLHKGITAANVTPQFREKMAQFRAKVAEQAERPTYFNDKPLTFGMLGNLVPLIAREVNAQQNLVPKALFEQVAGHVFERAGHVYKEGLQDHVKKVREREAVLNNDELATEFDDALLQLKTEAEAVLRSGVSTDFDIRGFMMRVQNDIEDARRQVLDANCIKQLQSERRQKEKELKEREAELLGRENKLKVLEARAAELQQKQMQTIDAGEAEELRVQLERAKQEVADERALKEAAEGERDAAIQALENHKKGAHEKELAAQQLEDELRRQREAKERDNVSGSLFAWKSTKEKRRQAELQRLDDAERAVRQDREAAAQQRRDAEYKIAFAQCDKVSSGKLAATDAIALVRSQGSPQPDAKLVERLVGSASHVDEAGFVRLMRAIANAAAEAAEALEFAQAQLAEAEKRRREFEAAPAAGSVFELKSTKETRKMAHLEKLRELEEVARRRVTDAQRQTFAQSESLRDQQAQMQLDQAQLEQERVASDEAARQDAVIRSKQEAERARQLEQARVASDEAARQEAVIRSKQEAERARHEKRTAERARHARRAAADGKAPSQSRPSASREEVCSAIYAAIKQGVPLWNSGNQSGCTAIYRRLAERYASDDSRLAVAVRKAQFQSAFDAGWTLRKAMDAVLDGPDQSQRPVNAVEFEDREGDHSTIRWNPATSSLEWWANGKCYESQIRRLKWFSSGDDTVVSAPQNTILNARLVRPPPGMQRERLKQQLSQLSQRAGISFQTLG